MYAKRGDHCRWHCGDKVYDVIDPRHVGTIREIDGAFALVEWRRNLQSRLPLRHLRPAIQPALTKRK